MLTTAQNTWKKWISLIAAVCVGYGLLSGLYWVYPLGLRRLPVTYDIMRYSEDGREVVGLGIVWWYQWVLYAIPPVAMLGCVAVYQLLVSRRQHDAETRCRRCGHALRELTEPRCPKCGQAI